MLSRSVASLRYCRRSLPSCNCRSTNESQSYFVRKHREGEFDQRLRINKKHRINRLIWSICDEIQRSSQSLRWWEVNGLLLAWILDPGAWIYIYIVSLPNYYSNLLISKYINKLLLKRRRGDIHLLKKWLGKFEPMLFMWHFSGSIIE